MHTLITRLAGPLALTIALAAPPALAQQSQGAQSMQKHGNMSESPASKAMMDSMQKMQKAMMAKPMTGDPDHDFATMMREHHKGAVDMARVELENGKDPELKKMAQKVIEDQSKEIKTLDQWIDQHPPKSAH